MNKSFSLGNQVEIVSQSFLKDLPESLKKIELTWKEIQNHSFWNEDDWQNYISMVQNLIGISTTFDYKKITEKARILIIFIKNIVNKKNCTPVEIESMNYLIFSLLVEVHNENLKMDIIKENKKDYIKDIEDIRDYEAVYILQIAEKKDDVKKYLENSFPVKTFYCKDSLNSAIESHIPRCILVDIGIVNFNILLIQSVTKNQIVKTFNIPVIFLLPEYNFSLQLKIAKMGGSLVLTKPLERYKIYQAIKELSPPKKKIPHILIVNDDVATVEIYSSELKKFGMRTKSSSEHYQVFQSLSLFHPDVILIDLCLKNACGLQIAIDIRNHEEYRNIPVIFISGETETEMQFEAMRYGDDFILKPVKIEVLVHLVNVWLELKEAKIENSSVRLSREKFLKKLNEDKENTLQVSNLQIKIKQLEKEIIDIKQLPENEDFERNTVLPGSNGDSYIIEKILAYGGMGTIYLANLNGKYKKVVIKVLSNEYMVSVKDTMRFLQEAKIIMKLDHPNLIKGYDYFQCQKLCYMVMEYIRGESLMDILDRNKTLSPKYALNIAYDISLGLKYMENSGIVHRDIKPENILIAEDNTPKLIDFGILKMAHNPCSLTTTGIILGTPFYISPEQIYQSKVDIRSDIYSLGATLFHMVTGQMPFNGENPIDVMQQRLFRTPSAIERKEDLALSVSHLIEKMMQKEIKNRYASVDELLKDIDKVRNEIL